MSRLHNGYMTRFYGAALADDKACIVMEYMAQRSLKDFLVNMQDSGPRYTSEQSTSTTTR